VLADDPILTVRGAVVPRKPPVRIVLDSAARTPLTSQLVRTVEEAPVWLFCAHDVEQTRIQDLTANGVRVSRVARGPDGVALTEVLDLLWQDDIRSVFCEGGAKLAAALARAGRIDRFYHFVAPRVLGAKGLGGFDDFPPGSLVHLALTETQRFGPDVLHTYDRARPVRARTASERDSVVHGLG
jgi:diaminohydroxyphosphoribosylaminopyrimidine deaminase/5-amino-6-(5-phosphoribosylamino)uracil reductase